MDYYCYFLYIFAIILQHVCGNPLNKEFTPQDNVFGENPLNNKKDAHITQTDLGKERATAAQQVESLESYMWLLDRMILEDPSIFDVLMKKQNSPTHRPKASSKTKEETHRSSHLQLSMLKGVLSKINSNKKHTNPEAEAVPEKSEKHNLPSDG